MTICLVAGARPNFMKIAPLLETLKTHPDTFHPFFIHTGQHYDAVMSRVFFEDLGLPEPDVYLGVGSAGHAVQTARIMTAFEPVVEERNPALVVVAGDVNSTIACGLVAAKCGVPLAHIEAGLRSRDRRMPEEINRILTDQLSELLFTTSREAGDNLRAEGVAASHIHFTGNLMIESLIRHRSRFEQSTVVRRSSLENGAYALVTLHRPSNVDDSAMLYAFARALARISRSLPVVFPVHPRTANRIEALGLGSAFGEVRLCEPCGYIDFMALQMNAAFVITDSGGIQEETTYFGVPCLTVRGSTERPVTVSEGTNILVGADPEALVRESEKILAGDVKQGTVPELWDSGVSGRIAQVLRQWRGTGG
ncbi:UDP-N-acetylglucosamine 2-epimerase (non-hydrolyzing) [bacterium]|nr:UDP-N-acetylglucosamine 2-epimerase (non-hydrolyzing) [bacterium]